MLTVCTKQWSKVNLHVSFCRGSSERWCATNFPTLVLSDDSKTKPRWAKVTHTGKYIQSFLICNKIATFLKCWPPTIWGTSNIPGLKDIWVLNGPLSTLMHWWGMDFLARLANFEAILVDEVAQAFFHHMTTVGRECWWVKMERVGGRRAWSYFLMHLPCHNWRNLCWFNWYYMSHLLFDLEAMLEKEQSTQAQIDFILLLWDCCSLHLS